MKQVLPILLLTLSSFAGEARIHGFFVQPSLGYGATDFQSFSSQAEYDSWVQSMADVGAEMLFYQWSAHYWADQTWFSNSYGGEASSDFAFYNPANSVINGISTRGWVTPTNWPGAPNTGGKEPVQYLLDACEKVGIKLWLGLYLNEDPASYNWWTAVSDASINVTDQGIIDHHTARSIQMIADLDNQFGTHPALGGYYYPVEVANIAFVPPANWPILAALLDTVADAVHATNPAMKLAISPFFNTALAPADSVGAMWEYALGNSDLDIIMLQDGAGVDPFSLTQSTDLITPYYSALKNAADVTGKTLWGNAELFTNRSTRATPDFVPSDTAKILRQLRAEAPYVEKFVCFGFHYMDPNPAYAFTPPMDGSNATDAALRAELYKQYQSYWNSFENVTTLIEMPKAIQPTNMEEPQVDLLGRKHAIPSANGTAPSRLYPASSLR